MNKLFLFFFLFPFLSFSQGQNELFRYYENGNIRSVKRNIDSNVVEVINYSIYGVMMDSIRFKDEQPIGGIARYHDSGRLKGTVRSIDSNTVEFINYSHPWRVSPPCHLLLLKLTTYFLFNYLQ